MRTSLYQGTFGRVMSSICHDKRIWPGLAISVLLLSSPAIVSGAEQAPNFTNDLGWTWHFKPFPLHFRGSPTALSDWELAHLYPLSSHELLLTWACQDRSFPPVLLWRPIAFNASGERFEFAVQSAAGTSTNLELYLRVYLLNLTNAPIDQLKFFGIEQLTEEGYRNARVPAASQKLKAAGVAALPLPRLGEPYDFEVTVSDGKKIRAADLRGKVVLLDFWATWCPPCMAKMPHLKEIYRRLHEDGFEIIGLNQDHTLAAATRAIANQALPWPNVPGPEDKSHRELWGEATGTFYIPRLLLIDRNGVLKADTSPDKLDTEIEKLMRQQ